MATTVDSAAAYDRGTTLDSAGEAIRALREQAGLSLTEFANLLGWDKGRLSKYENNQIGLSSAAIEHIAHGLGVEPLYVHIECLKAHYPHLRRSNSKLGSLLDQLVKALCKPPAKR